MPSQPRVGLNPMRLHHDSRHANYCRRIESSLKRHAVHPQARTGSTSAGNTSALNRLRRVCSERALVVNAGFNIQNLLHTSVTLSDRGVPAAAQGAQNVDARLRRHCACPQSRISARSHLESRKVARSRARPSYACSTRSVAISTRSSWEGSAALSRQTNGAAPPLICRR